MVIDDLAKSLAVLTAWREERSNKLNGMLAVLFLVRNRVHAGWFHGDWYSNLTAKNQFSSMTVVGDSQTIRYPDPRDPEVQTLMQHVETIFDGTAVDNLTSGALYYCDLNNPTFTKGGWFDRNIIQSPEHPIVAKVGSTTYFK